MIVTDAPGAAQNEQGSPFSGKSGELLYRMIGGGLGLEADHVYVTSLLKCYPHAQPPAEAIEACLPYLAVELELAAPQVVLALGALSFQHLSGTREPLERARGRSWPIALAPGIKAPLFASYAPAFLSLNPSAKRGAMADLKLVLDHLNRAGR
jgi:DNA polymerase